MGRSERERRDLLIAFEYQTGATQKEIARRHGVDPRTVRRALKRLRDDPPMVSVHEPLERLESHLLWLERGIEDLALARTSARSSRTQIAAIKTQHKLM